MPETGVRKEEKERKGGIPPIAPVTLRASSTAAGSAIGGAGAWGAAGGLRAWLAGFLSSSSGMLVSAVLIAGLLSYGLFALFGARVPAAIRGLAHRFPKPSYGSDAAKNLPTDGALSGGALDQLASANHGALGDGQTPPSAQNMPTVEPPTAPAAQASSEAQPGRSGSAPDRDAQSLLKKAEHQAAGGMGQGAMGMAGSGQPEKQGTLLAKADAGALQAMPGSVRVNAQARSTVGRAGRGGAMGQLRRSAVLSGQAGSQTSAGNLGQGYTTAAAAFGGQIAGGSAGGPNISGSGVGSGPGETGVSGAASGNPILSPDSSSSGAPAVGQSQNVTPWMNLVMMAMAMLMIASLIIFVMGLLKKLNKFFVGGAHHTLMMMLYGTALALAAGAAAMGIMIVTMYGQTAQGTIIATGGAITAAAAAFALFGGKTFDKPMAAWFLMLAGIAGMATSVMALMSGGGIGNRLG